MKNNNFKFYSVLKNEDANPYIGNDIIVVADGLGGSGSTVHEINREKHKNIQNDIMTGAFCGMKDKDISSALRSYIEELIKPMTDGKDDSSALWASRIVIARCIYALTEGELKESKLSEEKIRQELVKFILKGLNNTVEKFKLQNGKYDGQLLLPTTLSLIRYTEKSDTVIAETLWAGDSRSYALTKDGLKLLSKDDEDNSGSITNLFYADNKKVTLNYRQYEIEKPCALLVVSDGVFDPFDPDEHLGVEYVLLTALQESTSFEDVAEKLRSFYSEVRGDDATMAFVSFGINDFDEMKRYFEDRAKKIKEFREEQIKYHSALEVLNLSEEEAKHYVTTRTQDKYDTIADMLVEAIQNDLQDIAFTPELQKILAPVVSSVKISVDNDMESELKSKLEKFNESMQNPADLDLGRLLTETDLRINDINLKSCYKCFKFVLKDIDISLRNKRDLENCKERLERNKQDYYVRITEKINNYRTMFEDACAEKYDNEKNDLLEIANKLDMWQKLYIAVRYRDCVIFSNAIAGRQLTHEEKASVDNFNNYLDEVCDIDEQYSNINKKIEKSTDEYIKLWEELYNQISKNRRLIPLLFNEEIVKRFGFNVSDEEIKFKTNKKVKTSITNTLKDEKERVVFLILKALSENYDQTSFLDSQYNATKLGLFRTYFRLKNRDNSIIMGLRSRLAELEKEYVSLLNDEDFNL